MTAAVQTQGLTRRFGDLVALDRADLCVAAGEFHALLGPSGSGKTTLLRLVAGFDAPSSGAVSIDGVQVAGDGVLVPPERRRVGMVFQDYALFPHLTVARNVGFGIRAAPDRAARVRELLELTGLADRADALPHQLSGGQMQRVALARALAPRPGVVLLDEPFSNLDARLRESVRTDVQRILSTVGTTAVLVTHDQEEALSLADRVSVLLGGRIVQSATPVDLYARPADVHVAEFLGEANLLDGRASGASAACCLGAVAVAVAVEGAVTLLVRPEQVLLVADGVAARVARRTFLGHGVLLDLELDGGESLRARVAPHGAPAAGDDVQVAVEGSVVAWPA